MKNKRQMMGGTKKQCVAQSTNHVTAFVEICEAFALADRTTFRKDEKKKKERHELK